MPVRVTEIILVESVDFIRYFSDILKYS